ncbi:hypothetical protein PTKIN_Ptkin14bG0134900 [Pterospermum kingtungense]
MSSFQGLQGIRREELLLHSQGIGLKQRCNTQWNNRRIDGWVVSVKRANDGWKAKRKTLGSQEHDGAKTHKDCSCRDVRRDDKCYRDVLLSEYNGLESSGQNGEMGKEMREKRKMFNSNNLKQEEGSNDQMRKVMCIFEGFMEDELDKRRSSESDLVEVVSFDHILNEADLKCLYCCAVGRVKEGYSLSEIQYGLQVKKIYCDVCVLGGVSVLIKFKSEVELEAFFSNFQVSSSPWCEDLKPWRFVNPFRSVDVWVSLQEVPLHVWDMSFFKTLGDKWGSFIRLDYNAVEKKRFDIARMLVSVESAMKIPSVVSIKQECRDFKILVSIDDDLEIKDDQEIQPGSEAAMDESGRRTKEDEQLPNSIDVVWIMGHRHQ